MSLKAMEDFMAMVTSTEALHESAIDAWTRGGTNSVVALGQQHGYAFTPEEVIAVGKAAQRNGSSGSAAFDQKLSAAIEATDELSDAHLELVAGGTSVHHANGIKSD